MKDLPAGTQQARATEAPADGDSARDKLNEPPPTTRRSRLLAATALVLYAIGVLGAIALAVDRFPRGLVVAALLAGTLVAVAFAAVHLGAGRWIALAVALVFVVALVVLWATSFAPLAGVGVLALVVLACAAARAAFTAPANLPSAPRPLHAVVFWNPNVRWRQGRARSPGRGSSATRD